MKDNCMVSSENCRRRGGAIKVMLEEDAKKSSDGASEVEICCDPAPRQVQGPCERPHFIEIEQSGMK